MPTGKAAWWKTEDWMSVWLGFAVILLIAFGLQVQRPSFTWVTDGAFATTASGQAAKVESLAKAATEKGETGLAAAAVALNTAIGGGDRKAIGDAAKKLGAAAKDADLKKRADGIGKKLSTDAGNTLGKAVSGDMLGRAALIGLGLLVLFAVGNVIMGRSLGGLIVGFPVVYFLTWLSMLIAGNSTVTYYGLEFALWAWSSA